MPAVSISEADTFTSPDVRLRRTAGADPLGGAPTIAQNGPALGSEATIGGSAPVLSWLPD